VASEVVVKVREARLSVSWQRFENTDISFRQCSLRSRIRKLLRGLED